MADSKAKLKSRGDKASPCFRPICVGKLGNNILFQMFFIFLFLSICMHYKFRPLWAILKWNTQSLEVIMPATDPLFLLGYTIIIYIFVSVFLRIRCCRFSRGYEACL
jgi:membrane-bound metal-dependent hydrolase YbcI (DUF457 family)